MSLTKEVRDFFTLRIAALIDAKIKEASSGIDESKVLKVARERFCKKWGISQTSLKRWEEIQKEQKALETEESEIQNEVYKAINRATDGRSRFYSGNCVNGVDELAREAYRTEVIKELYPSVVPEIEKLQKIKDDVHSVVMLATTETKLVSRLTAVLKKYGGSVQELLDYIPDQDF